MKTSEAEEKGNHNDSESSIENRKQYLKSVNRQSSWITHLMSFLFKGRDGWRTRWKEDDSKVLKARERGTVWCMYIIYGTT